MNSLSLVLQNRSPPAAGSLWYGAAWRLIMDIKACSRSLCPVLSSLSLWFRAPIATSTPPASSPHISSPFFPYPPSPPLPPPTRPHRCEELFVFVTSIKRKAERSSVQREGCPYVWPTLARCHRAAPADPCGRFCVSGWVLVVWGWLESNWLA